MPPHSFSGFCWSSVPFFPGRHCLRFLLSQCRAALPPIRSYLKAGKWDKARTNVNYCTRVLRLSTSIRSYATALGGDAYYDALDVLSDVMNLTTQLDASAYTAGFIPADEGEIPLEAKKYMEQVRCDASAGVRLYRVWRYAWDVQRRADRSPPGGGISWSLTLPLTAAAPIVWFLWPSSPLCFLDIALVLSSIPPRGLPSWMRWRGSWTNCWPLLAATWSG